jgi:hypothetical protein
MTARKPRLVLLLCGLLCACLIGLHLSRPDGAAAQRSSDCKPRKANHRDPNTGRSWNTVFYCNNAARARIYANASTKSVVGWMDTRTSWFVCYARGEVHAGRNDIWYYTQGDRAAPGRPTDGRGGTCRPCI